MTDDADDLIAEQATEAPPPEPVPDAAELPPDVKDGVAGEPDSDTDQPTAVRPSPEAAATPGSTAAVGTSPDADDGADPHTEDE